MENYRKAPKIYHDIKKEDLNYLGNYFLIYQRLYEIIYYKLSGKHGNQIKLIQTLLGTIGDGSFGVSEKWITHTCRFSQQRYIEARKSLIEMGWLELKDRKITVKISNMLKDGELMDLEDAHADNVDEEDKTHVESNNQHVDNKETHVDSEKAHAESVRNREEQINNKEITTEVVLNLYNKLGNEYNIQIENIRTRIEKKLSALNRVNIDMYDFLDFWINIISDLKENRFDKNIAQSAVIEYDLSTALNKYDSAHNVDFKSGYKIYKTDILDIYDQEKYDKIIACIKESYYEFKEDNLWWFNNESKKAYKISTFMRYRNLKEYKYVKKPKKEYDYESQY